MGLEWSRRKNVSRRIIDGEIVTLTESEFSVWYKRKGKEGRTTRELSVKRTIAIKEEKDEL